MRLRRALTVALPAACAGLVACTDRPLIGELTTGAGISSTGAGSTGGASTTSGSSTGSSGSSSGSTTGGGCSPACGADATCENGVCRCINGSNGCPVTDGGLSCVDEKTDASNCGGCGNVCPSDVSCLNGICACDAGPACPNGGWLTCYSFTEDSNNCGFCGNLCPDIAPNCVKGVCQCGSGGSLILCGSPDAGNQACIQTGADPDNCGACGNVCDPTYATGSECLFSGMCACPFNPPTTLCATVPSSWLACACIPQGTACPTPGFVRDVYPLLAQTTGVFGCSASGCHSGADPAAGLGFLDETGHLDAGMAYAELLGTDGGGVSGGIPACDGGIPGAPSTQCACASRVVPGDFVDSYLYDVLASDQPTGCDTPNMPINDDGGWSDVGDCGRQLIVQWVQTGAGQ